MSETPEQLVRQQMDAQSIACGCGMENAQSVVSAMLSDVAAFVACHFGRVSDGAATPSSSKKRDGGAASPTRRAAGDRHQCGEAEWFKSCTCEGPTKRGEVNLNIFWLKDVAIKERANLPAPEIMAADITAGVEAALEQFAMITKDAK